MFQRSADLLTAFYQNNPQKHTLIDFGVAPTDAASLQDWQVELFRFLTAIAKSAEVWAVSAGYCPVYTVQRNGKPADVLVLQKIINRVCYPMQTTNLHGEVLEIHILGD